MVQIKNGSDEIVFTGDFSNVAGMTSSRVNVRVPTVADAAGTNSAGFLMIKEKVRRGKGKGTFLLHATGLERRATFNLFVNGEAAGPLKTNPGGRLHLRRSYLVSNLSDVHSVEVRTEAGDLVLHADPERACLKKVTIHTDGGCEGNPGPGGWAALLRFGEHLGEVSGGEPATTNNRMELRAAIAALEALTEPCEVDLFTDSEYLRNGITSWIRGWKARGWRTADKKPVRNEDLWRQLDAATVRHKIEWRWLKGHAGHADNERCDVLAAAEISKIRQTFTRAQLDALRDEFQKTREPQSAQNLLV